MTKNQLAERIALGIATIATVAALLLCPSWHGEMTEICRLAGIAAIVTMVSLIGARFTGRARIPLELGTAALFLAGMPLVYVVRWWEVRGGGGHSEWLWVELAGIPIYAGLTALGLRRSPWFLVAGIAAHGIAWDAWHWIFGSAYMSNWYSIGCLLCDVGIALYLLFRIPDWTIWRLERVSQSIAPSRPHQLPARTP
jgi:hypothetical protein